MFLSKSKKGSRFNAQGRAAYARTPKFKLYKAPVQRIKKYTTATSCFATLAGWFRDSTLNYYGYQQPYQCFPAYGLTPAAGEKGMMAMCEGGAFRIPRYQGNSNETVGNQQLKPAMCRFSDTVRILKFQVTRTVHNATLVPFMVRTFVFHNTGKISPIWSFSLPFNGGGPSTHNWYSGLYPSLNLGYASSPSGYTDATVPSGIRCNPSNLFMDAYSRRLDSVRSDCETITNNIQLDPDVVDSKSDIFTDSIVKVDPVQLNYSPIGIDGACICNPNVPNTQREFFIRQNTNSNADKTRVDHFNMRYNKSLEFEEEGSLGMPKSGDLHIVHMLVPSFEPCPDRSAAATPMPNPLLFLDWCNSPFGQIEIRTTVDVFFTDGT